MECPNYNLLESLLFGITWKAKFGEPTATIDKFLCQLPDQNVYDAIVKIVSDPNNIIDCQFAKILFRIIIELKNKNETFDNYCEWRYIDNILFSTWNTFLENNPPEIFNYMVIFGLPGITLEDIPPLIKEAYLETYWYSPKVTVYILLNDLSDVEMPGIHCIYHDEMWLYFDEEGSNKVNDVNIIINKIENYCRNIIKQEPGLIVMNPEDTIIAFNEM
jgi:hypothetical protein